jgi:hypothetical protein
MSSMAMLNQLRQQVRIHSKWGPLTPGQTLWMISPDLPPRAIC